MKLFELSTGDGHLMCSDSRIGAGIIYGKNARSSPASGGRLVGLTTIWKYSSNRNIVDHQSPLVSDVTSPQAYTIPNRKRKRPETYQGDDAAVVGQKK